jgi:hypothetical protein
MLTHPSRYMLVGGCAHAAAAAPCVVGAPTYKHKLAQRAHITGSGRGISVGVIFQIKRSILQVNQQVVPLSRHWEMSFLQKTDLQ